jgi:hypothetical protein
MIPRRAESQGVIGDGFVEIGPEDPEYGEWNSYLLTREEAKTQKTIMALTGKAGRNAIVDALTALDAIPATSGKIPTPWPIGELPTLDPEAWEASKIETVPIAELTATQRTLNVERVREYVQNPGRIDENRRALANVYANSDGLMIVDGHHRLAALWLLGADNANVWFLGE